MVDAPLTFPSGVKISLVSKDFLEGMPTPEKVGFILDEVGTGKVLVLERGLTATEEAELIAATMQKIEPDGFTGIEIQSYGQEETPAWARWLYRKARPRMVIIGPATLLRTLSKDQHAIETVAVTPSPTPTGA